MNRRLLACAVLWVPMPGLPMYIQQRKITMKKLFSKEQQAVEKAHHLVMDLSEPSALQKIQEATGGDFNLATEANLAAGWMKASGFYGGKKLGMQLLKKGGVYYNGDERKATLKE